tara:strand:- start:475 stop:1092 length:618 start_codon:yes stop_codon:yes gene_type:complete
MKTLLLFATLALSINVFGQDVNKELNGYTEIVAVELSKQEIHLKINEWIAVNFKSANDVVQLSTEKKVIAKGNFTCDFNWMKLVTTYRVHNSLIISIRDNEYKIDLVPSSVSSDLVGGDFSSSIFPMYLTQTVLNKDEFSKIQSEMLEKSGLSEKQIKKMTKNMESLSGEAYESYLLNKTVWDNEINSFFQSIKKYVSQTEDEDW